MKIEPFLKPLINGIAIIATAVILGSAFKHRNATQDSISVVGFGTGDFESDEIYWPDSYSARAKQARDAYTLINGDREKVRSFFIAKGFKAGEYNFGGVSFEKAYRIITVETRGETTKTEQVFDGYIATQAVTFNSRKDPALMKKIENVVDQASELINSGIEFEGSKLQYTYSDLASLKHNLIEKASQDARERVQKIVNTAGGHLGKLKDASMGVFQITGQGSVEDDSSGGQFRHLQQGKISKDNREANLLTGLINSVLAKTFLGTRI